MASVLKRAFSETRTDQYPIFLICRPEIESTFWRLGAGRPMLTASVSRLRTGPVAGADSTTVVAVRQTDARSRGSET